MVVSLAKMMIAFLFIDLGLQFYEYLVGVYSLADSQLQGLATMMGSSYSWSFWGVQMFIGAVVPIFIVFWKKTSHNINALLLASVFVVIGIIGVRFNIVVSSQIVPILDGYPAGNYFPTLRSEERRVGIVCGCQM